MPIWLELLVMLLVTYAVGLALGWALWGRAPVPDSASATPDETQERNET